MCGPHVSASTDASLIGQCTHRHLSQRSESLGSPDNSRQQSCTSVGFAIALTGYRDAQALQDKYGGWASPRIVPDYADYAEAAFRAFGPRVQRWCASYLLSAGCS